MGAKFIEKCFVAGVSALLFAGAAAKAEVAYFVANLSNPGTLKQVVNYTRLQTLDSLVVVGPMNEQDFEFLNCEGGVYNGKLSVLNLENAQPADNRIPEGAFAPDLSGPIMNPNLRRVILPNSVDGIGDKAFWANTQLSTINFPSTLREIGDEAFSYCHNLTSITFPDGSKEVWPSTLQHIGCRAFANCENVKGKVKIPENGEILSEAFYNTSITGVEFPEHPGTIGWGAFARCKLRRVHIPESAGSCCVPQLFAYNELLEEISIPASWDTLPDNYLRGCVSLKSLTLPPALTVIKEYALQGCSSLKSLTMSPALTKIENSALQGCTSLESLTLPPGLGIIESNALQGCTSLKSLTLPSGLGIIESGALQGCISLKSLTLPSSLTSIGENAFSGCSSLQSMTIPNSVTELGSYALSGCTSLEEVALPEDMEIINDYLLSDCPSLKSLRLPRNLSVMGWGVLRNDSSLTQIAFPEGFTEIYYNALRACVSLKTIILPSTFQTMHYYSFGELPSLQAVYCKAWLPPVFSGRYPEHEYIPDNSTAWGSPEDSREMRTNPNATIYIPKGSLDAYRISKAWKYFTNFVELEDDEFPSGIDDIPAQSIHRISVAGDGLTVSGVESPERYAVYDMAGRRISSGMLTRGDNRISLPSGLFIFTAGGHAEKIRVR